MKLNYAALALFASVAMMCSESNGDLLSRMLGRGGCGGCQATSCCDTPAPACGGRGFSISLNLNIGRPGRLFRGCGNDMGGCGAVDSCGAIDTCGGGCGDVVDSCGGGVRGRLSGLFSRLGSCGGCGAPAGDCGCGMPAPVMDSCNTCGPTCGEEVDACGGGLLAGRSIFSGRFLSRLRGIGGGGCGADMGCGCGAEVASDCGCSAPMAMAAPIAMPAPMIMSAPACGCESADTCGCGGGLNIRGRVSGLLSRVGSVGCGTCGSTDACGCGTRQPVRNLVGRLSNVGGCGSCGAPAGDCGCGMAAPVTSCGCDNAPSCGCNGGGRVKNILGRIPRPFKGGCGCGVSTCDGGCGASACGSSRLTLLDRVRGHRTPRTGAGCNDGCNPPCPNSGCSSCAGGAIAQPCNSCGGGAVESYAPMQYDNGTMYQENIAPIQAQPMDAVPESTEGSVIVPSADGASNRQPVVDPSAFVIRGK